MTMVKLFDKLISDVTNKEIIEIMERTLKDYPTEKGFRVDFFISPDFLSISVYKMEFSIGKED